MASGLTAQIGRVLAGSRMLCPRDSVGNLTVEKAIPAPSTSFSINQTVG